MANKIFLVTAPPDTQTPITIPKVEVLEPVDK